MKRKPPNLREKLAATLLMMVRPGKDGTMQPVIPFVEAKKMTAREIIGAFDFDHDVYVAIGGDNHPSNLTPRLRAEHREKTKRDLANIAKVKRGIKKRNPVRGAEPCQWAEQGAQLSRPGPKRKGRPIPGSRNTPYRKKINGTVERRQ